MVIGATTAAFICTITVGLASADPSNTPPADCSSSFDPYGYTQSAVASCGYGTSSQTSVTAMAGGGSSYNYDVNGADAHVYVPPAGFNPTTATDAQLDEYGFPPRPTDPTDLQQWQDEFSSWTGAVTPASFLAQTNMTTGVQYSTNWSGYIVHGSRGTYNQADTEFVEPSQTYDTSCSKRGEATWAGIGGWASGDPLAQDGSYIGNAFGDISSHQAWTEIVPQESSVNALPFHASPGHHFYASTRWLGNGYYRFFMYNDYTGKSWAEDQHTLVGYGGLSSEVIFERPTYAGTNKLSDLTNIDTLTFAAAKANGVGINTYSPSGVRDGIYMVDNSGNNMAIPSAIGGSGSFTDTVQHCS